MLRVTPVVVEYGMRHTVTNSVTVTQKKSVTLSLCCFITTSLYHLPLALSTITCYTSLRHRANVPPAGNPRLAGSLHHSEAAACRASRGLALVWFGGWSPSRSCGTSARARLLGPATAAASSHVAPPPPEHDLSLRPPTASCNMSISRIRVLIHVKL